MPDTTQRRTSASSPPRPGWGLPWVLIGIGFLAGGTSLMATILAKIDASPLGSPLRRNTWMPVGFCSIFLVMGLAFLASGLSSIAARRRLARLAAAHPGEPWHADFGWNPEGQRERVLGAIMGPLVVVALVGLMMSPFNYWAFGLGGPWVLVALVVVVDLVILAGAAWVGLRALRKLRFGGAFIRYARFPFFLGERLDVRVGTRRPPAAGMPLEARLRVIDERLGYGRSQDHYQIYLDETTVAFDGVSPDVTVTFPLPDGDYLTELAAPSRRWWELHLNAKMPGADFDEDFVVPVYRRP